MVRISGLASGMDIDSIVKDMMKIKRLPLNKLNQQKQILEWQRDDYRSMNTLLSSLDRTIFDNVFLQKNFIAKKVTSSNESAVSAVALSANANVSNSIGVVSLATPASWKADGEAVLEKVSGPKTLTFNIKDPGVESEVRTVKVELSDGDSLETVLNKINNSDLGISAMKLYIPDEGDRIIFTSNKTGTGGSVVASDDDTKGLLIDLGFTFGEDSNNYTVKMDKKGKDAEVWINGYKTLQNSNTFTLNGIEYTLKGKTEVGSPAIVTTTTDVDTIFNNIKTFVDKYNEVIEKIQEKLNEERFRSYHPLSDEEQEAMTEKQVEKWEEKARSGLLRNDSILSRALSTMRIDLYSTVEGVTGAFKQLADIGIKTSSNYREGGKLILDEAKLKEAINKDPNAVYQLFSSDGDDYKEKGLARRLRDSIKNSLDHLLEKAGSSTKTNNQFTIGKVLNSVTSQIDRYERKMIDLEDRYYRQFAAMEKMIQQANSQSMSLMQYFS